MSKIKICGLKREEDIKYVNETKPDFAGFVFAGVKRKIDFKAAEKFKALLNKDIKSVGVFVNEPIENIIDLYKSGIIDLVQLHGEEDAEYIKNLKDKIDIPIIKAIRLGCHCEEAQCADEAIQGSFDYILFDSVGGGSGQSFDWNLIKDYKKPFFLAGGISMGNISEALKLNPYCIDLSSGVETDGVKDFDKIKKIVDIVRKT
ncbi:MAG: phosphoribosylanthranilate isomerase [Endomicrobia bacterium]|nr:phosphoribosylanthranilate isomerase [Endomicrobiia bacterium]MCL2506924.1 phosphoribosylanthranilate isomerase [Endomicrobiia bacterium]